ncbi:hypothetical protein PSYMO_34032, partial [Pseudomonas amygdali pv. mori str. 301020]
MECREARLGCLFSSGLIGMDMAVGMNGREAVSGLIVTQLNYLQLSSFLIQMLGLDGFLCGLVAEAKLPPCHVMTSDRYDPEGFTARTQPVLP